MDSQDAKIRVFIPDKYRYEGFTELENLIERHVDVVNMQQLYENPKLAQGLQVAFSVERRIAVILDLLHNSMLPDLKLICNHGAGVNHIPIADLNNLGIKVTNTPDVLSDGTADMGMALMLASARQLLLGECFSSRKFFLNRVLLFCMDIGQQPATLSGTIETREA